MTPPVSTSGGKLARSSFGEGGCGSVSGGVVGRAGEPAGPDDADPGAGEHADGVRVILAAGAGICVDLGGPGAGVAAVVGERGHCLAEALIAGPAEGHVAVLAGLPGHGRAPGQGGDGVGSVV